jgi:hypothetical protein
MDTTGAEGRHQAIEAFYGFGEDDFDHTSRRISILVII